MNRVVEIDEAIREARDAANEAWEDFQFCPRGSRREDAAYKRMMAAHERFRAYTDARARGETHVTVEDE